MTRKSRNAPAAGRLSRIATLVAGLALAGGAAAQQADDRIRIGFMTDINSVFASVDGPGGADAVRMAIEDFGGKVLGKPVEALIIDHQNKPDIGSARAREWLDRDNVQAMFVGSNSAVALALVNLANDKKKVMFTTGAGSPRLTNENCTPYTVQYAYNTDALVRTGVAAGLRKGLKSWYMLTADYAFGHAIEAEIRKQVTAGGGQVLGSVRHPINSSDFSSFLLQAQASKAQVLALANAGGDAVNSIKGAKEFGITPGMTPMGFGLTIDVVHSLGLPTAQGMQVVDHWHWTNTEASRRFAQRFIARNKTAPTSVQAANYSAVLTWLKAVQDAGTTDADKVMASLRKLKIDDMYAQGGAIRADGQMIHPIFLYQVKKPAEQKEPFDYYSLVATIPGETAFADLKDSACPLVKR